MSSLEERIKEHIRSHGPITFRDFMHRALYEPHLGYYMQPGRRLGRQGDFYTSVHLGPLFGKALGKFALTLWQEHLGGGPMGIAEFGPGEGLLARDILEYLRDKPLYAHLSYVLLEKSPSLRRRQAELLQAHRAVARWAQALGDFRGLVLCNEFLDALAVHLVEMSPGGLREVYVALQDGQFAEELGPLSSPALEAYIRRYAPQGLPLGHRAEVNLAMRDWLREVAAALKEGFVLVIDYGHPAWALLSPQRPRGSLLCYRAHRVSENPYEHIGQQDITAHVNFTALRDWAQEVGLSTLGFLPQGVFLVNIGLEEFLQEMSQEELLRAKTLLLPQGLGGTHKVMLQYKGPRTPSHLEALKMGNRLNTL
jgi:SAM-dependent MidA family methyltransferase